MTRFAVSALDMEATASSQLQDTHLRDANDSIIDHLRDADDSIIDHLQDADGSIIDHLRDADGSIIDHLRDADGSIIDHLRDADGSIKIATSLHLEERAGERITRIVCRFR